MKILIALFLCLSVNAQAQKWPHKRTTILVAVADYLPKPDSIGIKVAGFSFMKPFHKSFVSFVIDSLLIGIHPITVVYKTSDYMKVLQDENLVKFKGSGFVKIDILTRAHGKIPGPPYTGTWIKEFGQVTLRSTASNLNFIIDDDPDMQGSTGTTGRIKSLDPDTGHKIVWKNGTTNACIFLDYHLCSGCQETLICNPKTGKISKE